MILFALTDVAGSRVIRFPMSKELGDEVYALFSAQRDSFLNNVDAVVPFDGRYKPDDDELLSIADFPDVDGMENAVATPLSVDQFDPQVHSLSSVKALFMGSTDGGKSIILIQYFERRRLISTNLLGMFFSGKQFQKMTDSGLTFDKRLLAVLDNGNLMFQSFHFVKRVFDLDEYYREATSEEVASFAQHDKLVVADVDQFVMDCGPQTRKKISLILQSGVLDKYALDHIQKVAATMQLTLDLAEDGRIRIPSNRTELKKLLRFLDEDYYESSLSSTRYISNSKKVAD
ncbi:Kiwa anti-phage protein KwaB-like domain-containing protein [Pseudomonas syringae]|uniref:Kiwa anti-phage protein KwaB-like domain-containing protein n=1 Tax=Pseudomonas syringae TaxID=317 RepID=UPI001F101B11|nr:Kiwa anti-phage protein KwaB-like domain-containing protein [Pseudomonas syringae]MCH5555731.1 DUF4868 domain-containing protein [Pseudomonas syringae pv. syringae]MCH5576285.1 DUF4868 domain-containing protein [Pseudomonas syringae pv. syringae]MCH5668498.1 DUF4868 domain-containing protein [Pseudomonas syringae pv. syringae]